MTAVDWSGGLDASSEFPVVDPPDVPDFGENHAFWLFGDAGHFVAHFHIETIPGVPGSRRELGEIVLKGDRVLLFQGEGPGTHANTVCGANIRFRCEEPFVRWTGSFRATARDTSAKELASGPVTDGPRARVDLSFDARMAAPPWQQGSVSKDASSHMKKDAGRWVGGFRYEQLFRARVSLCVDGETQHCDATGLRTHRCGPRNVGTMLGHSWQTAVFPSGRAFGAMRYPAREGAPTFSEAFLFQEGRRLPARILESPWLVGLQSREEPFSIVLESEIGTTRIDAETIGSVFHTLAGSGLDLAWIRRGVHRGGDLVLAQAGARYTWDGETTHGLLERSGPVSKLVR